MKSYQQFFAELKRRKVFRVMAVYGATAFGVLQVADLLAEGMGLSDQVLRVTTFLVLIGFPIAIVLAWAFETTPDGVRRTEDASDEEIEAIIAQPAARRWTPGLLALAGAALLLGGWWMGQRGVAPELNLSVPEAGAADLRKIAVLPFQDLGGNEANDPFLSGLHADIYRRLLGLADLRVTSLGSVGGYGRLDQNAQQIASDLDVDYLVRGSVRRAGDRARVDVYLHDVAAREDMWIQQFDEEVVPENLFDVSSTIARAVADRLVADLTLEDIEGLESNLSSDNLAALTWYHRASQAWDDRARGGEGRDALQFAEQAVALDSEFVEAWSLLARIRAGLSVWEGGREGALAAVEQTERLASGSVAALKARGAYEALVLVDRQAALATYREVQSLVPSDAEAIGTIGALERNMGRVTEAAQTLKRAVRLDPRNPALLNRLAGALQDQGRDEAADRVTDRVLQLDPDNINARTTKVVLTFRLRGLSAARSLAAELGLTPDVWEEAVTLRYLATLASEFDVADDIAGRMAPDTLNLEELNRLFIRAGTRRWAGGDPAPFGDSLLALDLSGMPEDMRAIPLAIEGIGLVYSGAANDGWRRLGEAVREAEGSTGLSQGHSSAILSIAARLNAAYGRYDEMLEILEAHIERPAIQFSAAQLRVHPLYEEIRDDSRFQAVIQRRVEYEAQAARDAEAEGPWLP